MENLVAINVFDVDKIVNKNRVPILFYWDGITSISTALKTHEDFIKFLEKSVLNIYDYGSAGIAYFYFSYNEETQLEDYHECSLMLQSWMPIQETKLIPKILCKLFDYLYNCVYKVGYDFSSNQNDFESDICNIYDLIKTKNNSKVTKDTVINYVRSELAKTHRLNTDNTNYVIKLLKNILKDK